MHDHQCGCENTQHQTKATKFKHKTKHRFDDLKIDSDEIH